MMKLGSNSLSPTLTILSNGLAAYIRLHIYVRYGLLLDVLNVAVKVVLYVVCSDCNVLHSAYRATMFESQHGANFQVVMQAYELCSV